MKIITLMHRRHLFSTTQKQRCEEFNMNKTSKLILKHLIYQGFLSLLGEGATGPLFSEKIMQKLLCLGTKIFKTRFCGKLHDSKEFI